MNAYDRDFLRIGAVCFALVAIGCAMIWYGVRAECENKWADSGMQSRYVHNGGCQVHVGGAWIPESAVRIAP